LESCRAERIRAIARRELSISTEYPFCPQLRQQPTRLLRCANGLIYDINNHGFRGPDVFLEKAPGTFRIIVLGDSVTFGEGVKWEDTYTYRLQDRLHKEVSPTIEVLNFGVSSWSTTDEIAYLEQQGQAFQPDVVLLAYFLNDANYAGGLDLWEEFRASYEAAVLRHSYLFSYVYARIGQQVYGRRYVEHTLQDALSHTAEWERSMHLLHKGSVIANRIGAQYGVIIFPFMYRLDDSYPFVVIHDMIKQVCQEHDIPVLDLFPAYRGHKDTSLWAHPSDQHPNEIGHEIAAETIANFLISQEMVGERP
jgi:lysophospholipase L1-like esterase